jgi:hypothetical protein
VPDPKPFVLKILISKFFENQILRDTVLQKPRWARLSEISNEKNNLEICPGSRSTHKSRAASKIYFTQKIHTRVNAPTADPQTGRRLCQAVADS